MVESSRPQLQRTGSEFVKWHRLIKTNPKQDSRALAPTSDPEPVCATPPFTPRNMSWRTQAARSRRPSVPQQWNEVASIGRPDGCGVVAGPVSKMSKIYPPLAWSRRMRRAVIRPAPPPRRPAQSAAKAETSMRESADKRRSHKKSKTD
eukprot:6199028-Pleurochrysis_carterae.AAC.2